MVTVSKYQKNTNNHSLIKLVLFIALTIITITMFILFEPFKARSSIIPLRGAELTKYFDELNKSKIAKLEVENNEIKSRLSLKEYYELCTLLLVSPTGVSEDTNTIMVTGVMNEQETYIIYDKKDKTASVHTPRSYWESYKLKFILNDFL